MLANNSGAIHLYNDSSATYGKYVSDADFRQLLSAAKVSVQETHAEGQSGSTSVNLVFYLK